MEPIFHIAEEAQWSAAQDVGEYVASTRGLSLAEVGFIHCSHRHQVERVANAVYQGAGRLLLLTIDLQRVRPEVREESGGGVETFPHIYGPLPVEAVIDVSALVPAPGGLFVPSRSWLSPKLQVRPSDIHGFGLFAREPIEAGEPVSVMGGTAMTNDAFATFIAGAERWSAAAIDEGVNVVQDVDDPLAKGNHSCDPNLWMTDEFTLVARQQIRPGEEATVDYALMTVDEAWSMSCRCVTPSCRGAVTGADWRRADLQSRYRGHFSPFIERRIASEADERAGP